jgi:hypothetical protein
MSDSVAADNQAPAGNAPAASAAGGGLEQNEHLNKLNAYLSPAYNQHLFGIFIYISTASTVRMKRF